MDQIKIGRFIAECRKKQNLTQMQLAEYLGITDRAVSKWENGKSMPDSSIMLDLCGLLKISVNDLLNGEVVIMENYNEKTEQLLLEMVKQKEENDKRLLSLEILIGIFSVIIICGATLAASYLNIADWGRIIIIVAGFIFCIIGVGYCIKIEQCAGYYECAKCHHKHVPELKSIVWSMHMGRTRYMKCPECHQKSWQKKRISK